MERSPKRGTDRAARFEVESGRPWIRGLTAGVVALLVPACAGKSATHDRDGGKESCRARGDCVSGGTGATGGTDGLSGGTGGSSAGGNVSGPIFVYDENVYLRSALVVHSFRVGTRS
jgi:hypothetical protein